MLMAKNVGFSVFILTWQLVLITQYEVEENSIGLYLILFMAAITLGSFFAGLLIKRFLLFNTTFIGLLLEIASFFMLLFSGGLYFTVLSFVIYEIAQSISNASLSIWQNDYISSENRATYYSGLSSTRAITGILVVVSSGFLIETLGFTAGWVLSIISSLITFILLAIFVKKYSKFGLAFKKTFLIARGACPVFYVANETPVPTSQVFSPDDFLDRIKAARQNGFVDNPAILHAFCQRGGRCRDQVEDAPPAKPSRSLTPTNP